MSIYESMDKRISAIYWTKLLCVSSKALLRIYVLQTKATLRYVTEGIIEVKLFTASSIQLVYNDNGRKTVDSKMLLCLTDYGCNCYWTSGSGIIKRLPMKRERQNLMLYFPLLTSCQ